MGPHYLNRFFSAKSIAVIGASERADAVGSLVFANLISAGYQGDLYPINLKRDTIQGYKAYPDVEAIGRPVDLVVIATPARTVPPLIRQCGAFGIRSAVVLSAGFGEAGSVGRRLQEAMIDAAREYDVRIIGPNCLGIMRPSQGLNATFSKNSALKGDLALVSQSGAICTAILDWAETQQIGFSAVASMGDTADVDFGDVLDYLALDRETHSILVYVEGVRNARRFMSGLRAAARIKPVIVIKSGRKEEGSRAAMSHTGAIVGADDVFDASLERAGAVRALTISQLFSAARILSSRYRVESNRLAIISNAGGPGVMATDRAVEVDIELAQLTPESIKALNEVLPDHWSHGNPIDILGDADAPRYEKAISICLSDPNIDGALVMLTPQAMTQPTEVAQAVIDAAKKTEKPVMASWMGGEQVRAGRELFTKHHLPHFSTPEASVEAFAYLAAHQRNQKMLLQVPGPLSDRIKTDVSGARMIIEGALSEGRKTLSTMESKAVLSAFRIPVTQTVQARSANEALVAAGTVGYPVAMKIDSPDITHKSDVGGVKLNIVSAEAVRSAYQAMVEEARRVAPQARIQGVTVERMYKSTYGRELMIGVIRDPAFGPVVSFGSGGTSVEVMKDRAVALPPLNEFIIQNMIERTKVARMLKQFRNMPPVDTEALEMVLLRVSEMACELPEIQELDINPLIVDERGLAAVDARISVDYPAPMSDRYAHMAIHPYPNHWVTQWQLSDGTTLVIRPIRPEDAKIEQEFVRKLSAESRYFRFMQAVHELTPQMLVRFTQIDYDREMALIAVHERPDGSELQVAVARYTANPDQRSCEFALAVADEWKGKGIGSHLMHYLMDVAKKKGIDVMEGEILSQNSNMLALVKRLKFSTHVSPEDDSIIMASKRL
ncbi:bifunctional acetate--CoA ligase family protein/GNAT family N-acetyltransferase [Thiorhodospira sibirica]|uniref:bifunctional acetate--CoA ligase family protein/GNAT family N-acetyltransferase n=1 Tax=Thiorhodospira sibirica TaxID=154347 RepID=UPI00022C0442|nr:bifunctional acetate--CoA ligase family protein/GNAT family N-acetyltransferase [Thiorhodospira sibirica]